MDDVLGTFPSTIWFCLILIIIICLCFPVFPFR
jgi:hypothetical protein